MSRRTAIFKFGPVLALVAAVVIAVALIKTRDKPQRTRPQSSGALVVTEKARLDEHQLMVRAQGEVRAARTAQIQPQISGIVERVSSDLVPGGFVEAGQLLVKIEDVDYEIAVAERKAALAQAEAQFKLEQGQQRVAQREWEMFEGEMGASDEDASLALREPQLLTAEAAVQAARARLRQAEVNLQRASIEAPFAAFVTSETAEAGQYVNPQTPIATLAGSELFWVTTAIPVDELRYVQIPGLNATEGSRVTIRQDIGGDVVEWTGKVARLMSELDPVGRMARLLIEVPDPFGLETDGERKPAPLLLNAYVEVVIESARREDLIAIPREALREGDKVYVLSEDGALDIREVEIAWRRPDSVLVSGGLQSGERIVTSRIGTPVQGMRLRAREDAAGEEESNDQDRRDNP